VALLGTNYFRMKTEGGVELRDAFEDALRELKLQETPSISPDRQGKVRDGLLKNSQAPFRGVVILRSGGSLRRRS